MLYTLTESAPVRLVGTFKKAKVGVYVEFDILVSQWLAYKNETAKKKSRKFIHISKICLSPNNDNATAVLERFNLRMDNCADASSIKLPVIDNQLAKELFYDQPKYNSAIENHIEILHAIDDKGTVTDVNTALVAYWPKISNDSKDSKKRKHEEEGGEEEGDEEEDGDDEEESDDGSGEADMQYERADTPGKAT